MDTVKILDFYCITILCLAAPAALRLTPYTSLFTPQFVQKNAVILIFYTTLY